MPQKLEGTSKYSKCLFNDREQRNNLYVSSILIGDIADEYFFSNWNDFQQIFSFVLNPKKFNTMKTLKKIGIVLVSFVLLLVIVSFFLPSTFHVERSAVINANDSVIFSNVNNLKNFVTWMPWAKMDPNTKMDFFGPEQGLGQGYNWSSEKTGNGKMTIIESAPNQKVIMELDFEGMGKSAASFGFTKEGNATKVTWAMDSKGEGIPFWMIVPHKYMSLFMDKMVGADFENGLASLKSLTEGK